MEAAITFKAIAILAVIGFALFNLIAVSVNYIIFKAMLQTCVKYR